MGGGNCYKTTAMPVVQLVVTVLQLSHRAACNNTQHCLKLPTYCCIAVRYRTAALPVVQLAVTLLQLSYRAACKTLNTV
jgi:hypothetical protein